MDAQTQDTIRVSEKEQLTAPPGWTKKLVPASTKSITLRKYDVVFIAPDGQELKSKWHLTRYLKAHPEGPAMSEFNWSSGEEAPIRRSTRFATKEASEDNKRTSTKKGKRDAAEMEDDQEKTPSRKRAKKAGKSEGSNEKNVVEVAADVLEKDEVMHEAIACDNEATQDAAPCDEVPKNESKDANLVEAVIEKATDEGLDKQVKAEGSSAAIGEHQEDIQAKDEGLDKQVEEETIIVSNADIGGEHEEIQVKVVEVTESVTDNGLQENNQCKVAQETGTLVAPAEELEVEEVAMETEVIESKELLDEKLEENENVSCKITAVTSAVEGLAEGDDKPLGPIMQKEEPVEPRTQKEDSVELLMQKEEPLEPLTQKEDSVELLTQKEDPVELLMQKEEPLEPLTQKEDSVELLTQKEDSVEPLIQKEEQERLTHIQNSPLKVEHMKDKSSSEFSNSPVPVRVANE